MVSTVATQGVSGGAGTLPHAARIQRAFGKHDISRVRAHVGGTAATASAQLGAKAYAFGGHVAFASQPDLHTAAHEAAHVIQQRNGAVASRGLGAADDDHERNADRVADAVVAGESAESLLDATATGGNGSNHAIVQRKIADDIRNRALPQAIPLGTADTEAAAGVAEMFSGPKRVVLTHQAHAPGHQLARVLDAAGPRAPAGGSPEDNVMANLERNQPAILKEKAFQWRAGSTDSRTFFAAPDVAHYLRSVVYSAEAERQYTEIGELAYRRTKNHESVSTVIESSPNVLARIVGGVIKGSGQLVTPADATLFGKASRSSELSTILTDDGEVQRFVDVLAPTGSEGIGNWYEATGKTPWRGKASAAAWLKENNSNAHAVMLRSLQLFARHGSKTANSHMDELVDAMRGSISKAGSKDDLKRRMMENSVLGGGVAENVTIDDQAAKSVAVNPDQRRDTEDADFDRMRLAGDIIARRELVPMLKACLDPVGYIKAHPPEKGALGTRTAAWVKREAGETGAHIDDFINTKFNDRTLNPGDRAASSLAGQTDSASSNHAINAARLGAVEAVRYASKSLPNGSRGVTAHMAILNGMSRINERFNVVSSAKAIALSANEGMRETSASELVQDFSAIRGEQEMFQKQPDEVSRNRGIAINALLSELDSKTIRDDVASLRKIVAQDSVQAQKGADIQAVRSVAHAQALHAKSESNVAFLNAHRDYRAEFLDNIRGKFEEKKGGSKWATGSLLVANAAKEGMELIAEGLDEATSLAKGLGKSIPGLGTAIAIADAVVSFNDWRIKAKLDNAQRKMEREFNQIMVDAQSAMLGKIQSAAQAEVQVAAAGKARPAAGMKKFLATIATGKSASLPVAEELAAMEPDELDTFYTQLLTYAGPVQSHLYKLYLDAVSLSGQDLWKKFSAAIDGMEEVSKA